MAKIRYSLTAGSDYVRTEYDSKGNVCLVFEWDCEDHNVEDADSSGNYQSDCLWEIFEHSFNAFDDDGTPIDYDPETSERINPTSLEEKEIKTCDQLKRWCEEYVGIPQVTDVRRMRASSGVLNFVNINDRIGIKIDRIWKKGWVPRWKTMSDEDFAKWITPHVLDAIYKGEFSEFDITDKKFRRKFG